MRAIIINIVQLVFSNYVEMKFNLISFWVTVDVICNDAMATSQEICL